VVSHGGTGVGMTMRAALTELADMDPLTFGELASRLDISPAVSRRVLMAMQDRGLVTINDDDLVSMQRRGSSETLPN
jgi:Mn-dependent DtxR family transcriptional regulator